MTKSTTAILLLGTLLLSGCAHHYDMVLTNGMRVTRVSKPVLDRESGVYTFTDAGGNKRKISASRVEEIEPHSNKNESNFGMKQ
jgi:hypothetical protein